MKAVRRALNAAALNAAQSPDDPACAARSVLRRRGDVLLDAIRAAARTELAAVGYVAFSIESVASRAKTGKASIYRRWGNKQNLVLDSIECVLPTMPEGDIVDFVGPDTSTRDAILMMMRRMVAQLNGERSDLFRSIAADCARDEALADLVETCIVEPRREVMMRLLRHGVERGEVRPSAVNEQVTEVGPAMVFHAVLTTGAPPPDEKVVAMVDNLIMPILRP